MARRQIDCRRGMPKTSAGNRQPRRRAALQIKQSEPPAFDLVNGNVDIEDLSKHAGLQELVRRALLDDLAVPHGHETAIAFDTEYYREKNSVVGGYAHARLEPVEGTRVSFGGRTDHQKFTGIDQTKWDDNGLSGNVSAEQDLFGKFLTLRAGYSHVWAGVALEEACQVDVMTYDGNLDAAILDNYLAGLVARYGG